MRESDVQAAIMGLLAVHPRVAWAHVTTSGKIQGRGGHWITIGFPGLADIIGQLRDGKLFAIEVKKPGECPTDEQREFLDMVLRNNGVAGVACSVDDAGEIVG